jgi:hypothetical protein
MEPSVVATKMRRARLSLIMVLCMVVPFAVYVNGRIINKEIDRLNEPDRTEEARYEKRLEPLKEVLPEHGVVGYVTDERATLYKKLKDFYLAQYMLSPRVLVRDAHYPYVIGMYYEMAHPDRRALRGLTLVEDFGYGVELYQGKRQ